MAGFVAASLSFVLLDVCLVFVFKLPHGTFHHTVFVPVDEIGVVPVPDVGDNILFLCFKFPWFIKAELIVRALFGGFVSPFYIIAFDGDDKIAVRCAAAVDVAGPPCATCGTDVVFVDSRVRAGVFIVMRVSGEYMHFIGTENVEKCVGVADIASGKNRSVGYGCMEIEEHGCSFWHVA